MPNDSYLVGSLLPAIKEAALKKFVAGEVIFAQLYKEKRNPAFAEKFISHPRSYALKEFDDENFYRDVNKIRGSNFLATAGPGYSEIFYLIEDTLNNPEPIQHIVALGSKLSCDPYTETDFYNYLAKNETRLYYEENHEIKKSAFSVETKVISGVCQKDYRFGDFFKPVTIVKSELKVQDKILHATLIPLNDGCVFNFADDSNNELKETLLEISETANQLPVMVHCKVGLGRTGHLIFLLELFKDYQTIFAGSDPIAIAERILTVLERIRATRPCLVLNTSQFIGAIENAHLLYRYALEKKRELLFTGLSENSLFAPRPEGRVARTASFPSDVGEAPRPPTPTL